MMLGLKAYWNQRKPKNDDSVLIKIMIKINYY